MQESDRWLINSDLQVQGILGSYLKKTAIIYKYQVTSHESDLKLYVGVNSIQTDILFY